MRYNSDMELIERLEEEGKIGVIRPVKPIVVGRMERNTKRLLNLYDEGYEAASQIEFVL